MPSAYAEFRTIRCGYDGRNTGLRGLRLSRFARLSDSNRPRSLHLRRKLAKSRLWRSPRSGRRNAPKNRLRFGGQVAEGNREAMAIRGAMCLRTPRSALLRKLASLGGYESVEIPRATPVACVSTKFRVVPTYPYRHYYCNYCKLGAITERPVANG